MKRLLTAGIFGTILGIVGAGTANASIVSSGFLDEKLTEYALSTSLDLKANQSDLTALSNKIGDAWPYGSDISGGLYNLYWQLYPQEITLENASDLVRFLFGGKIESGINQGGVLNILGQSVVDTGAYDIKTGQIDEGFRSLRQLTNGWTSTDDTTYLGVKDLNTKTGSYYWGPENEEYKFSNIPYFEELFPGTSPDKSIAMNDMANIILFNYTNPGFPGIAGVTDKLLNGWTDAKGGIINPGLKGMYDGWTDAGYKIPGLYEIAGDTMEFKSAFPNVSIGMLLAHGLEKYTNGNYTGPVYPLWKLSEGIDKIDSIETKIGDLPSGQFHMRSPYLSIFASAGITELNYPTSLSDLFLYLFGSNEDTTKDGLFPVIGMRLNNISTQIDNINNTSNAIRSEIGTLPDGYDSVGAALTAIKGIAEDAKVAALAAIPDPKQEGSSGKFVLTVDIVGDNATYRWEKIDREGETTTTE